MLHEPTLVSDASQELSHTVLKPRLGSYGKLHFTDGETAVPGLSRWGQILSLSIRQLSKTDCEPQTKQKLPGVMETMRRTADMVFTSKSITTSFKAHVEFLPHSFVLLY